MTDTSTLDPTQRASKANPLPRRSHGDGYDVTIENLAERLHMNTIAARQCIEQHGVPYRPWFGGQCDIRESDATDLVKQYVRNGA